jgi:hypothetical protein
VVLDGVDLSLLLDGTELAKVRRAPAWQPPSRQPAA